MRGSSHRSFAGSGILISMILLCMSLCACGSHAEEKETAVIQFEEIAEAPAETEIPEEPEAPEVTEEPEEPEAPEKPDETEAAEETEVTEEPEKPAEPEATEEPEVAAEPEVTEEPKVAEEPEAAAKPDKPAEPEEPGEPEAPEAKVSEPAPVSAADRILFIGDSRTIDMFADSDDTISGAVIDGMTVYAAHGRGYDYMTGVINGCGIDSFDTLVTWMGANDAGDFSRYAGYYEGILAAGKRLVLCTVGPTNNSTLAEWDHPDYENENMVRYNGSLISWAQQHGVYVIDLYSYIAANVQIDDADGIHYLPRPTGSIWSQILSHKNGNF